MYLVFIFYRTSMREVPKSELARVYLLKFKQIIHVQSLNTEESGYRF